MTSALTNASLIWCSTSVKLLAHRTLFLFSAIFLHDRTRGRNIMDLSAFHMTGGNFVQIVLTGFTLLYVLLDDLIGRRRPVQARSLVSLLPTRFLLAFLPQTFRLVRETIRSGRQTAIVAVFRLSLLQRFYLLGQAPHLFLHLLH